MKLNKKTAGEYRSRIEALAANSTPSWGQLKPTELMAHFRRSLEMSLGEYEVQDRSKPVIRHFVYYLYFCLLTNWPKAKIKAPGIFFPKEGVSDEFDEEKKRVLAILDRFVEVSTSDPRRIETSPYLGPMPLRKWQQIHGVHLDHHLRQFGV